MGRRLGVAPPSFGLMASLSLSMRLGRRLDSSTGGQLVKQNSRYGCHCELCLVDQTVFPFLLKDGEKVPDPLAFSASLSFSPSLSKKGKTVWSTASSLVFLSMSV